MEIYEIINNINPTIMKQIFQLRETKRTVRNQYKLNLIVTKSIRLVMVKKVSDIMVLKSGTPFRFMLRLAKILKF